MLTLLDFDEGQGLNKLTSSTRPHLLKSCRISEAGTEGGTLAKNTQRSSDLRLLVLAGNAEELNSTDIDATSGRGKRDGTVDCSMRAASAAACSLAADSAGASVVADDDDVGLEMTPLSIAIAVLLWQCSAGAASAAAIAAAASLSSVRLLLLLLLVAGGSATGLGVQGSPQESQHRALRGTETSYMGLTVSWSVTAGFMERTPLHSGFASFMRMATLVCSMIASKLCLKHQGRGRLGSS